MKITKSKIVSEIEKNIDKTITENTLQQPLEIIGIDSLELINIIVKLENVFNMELFNDSNYENIHSLNDIVNEVQRMEGDNI